jgi:FlaG/FlaF family flagellin (archaellin)
MSVQHLTQSERAASPIVAFVLLFVVTVGVAGVMGAVIILNSGGSAPPAQAGLTVTQYEQAPGTELYTVEVQLINVERADHIEAERSSDTRVFASQSDDGTDHNGVTGSGDDIDAAGETLRVVHLSPGDTVTIMGSFRDQTMVLRTYTVR